MSMDDLLSPVLVEAEGLGLCLRPITGLVDRRARKLGVDLDALGNAEENGMDDLVYYDQMMVAIWLIGAEEEEIAAALEAGTGAKAAEAWYAKRLTSLAHERAAMRAFMARWLEYRVELDRLFGNGEEGLPATA